MTATGWRVRAACLNTPVDVFYPIGTNPADAAPAKAVCWDCPVRRPCLAYALARPEHHGIFGGLTINERHRIAQALRWDRTLALRLADSLADPAKPQRVRRRRRAT
jgi:WhiB family redox-sensing transcriptional regulator